LRLGRNAAALDELEQTLSADGATYDEHLVLRGGLRAAAGRWQTALADLHAVASGHPDDAPSEPATQNSQMRDRIERALWGRVATLSYVGDAEGAHADLRQCLWRFPHGWFAAPAAQLLGEEPS
jgi:hypothetical protein